MNGKISFPLPPTPIWESWRSREEVNMKTNLNGSLKEWQILENHSKYITLTGRALNNICVVDIYVD